jgi:hypothetical protein
MGLVSSCWYVHAPHHYRPSPNLVSASPPKPSRPGRQRANHGGGEVVGGVRPPAGARRSRRRRPACRVGSNSRRARGGAPHPRLLVPIRKWSAGQAGRRAITPAAGQNRRRRRRGRRAHARHHLLRHADRHRRGIRQGSLSDRIRELWLRSFS